MPRYIKIGDHIFLSTEGILYSMFHTAYSTIKLKLSVIHIVLEQGYELVTTYFNHFITNKGKTLLRR